MIRVKATAATEPVSPVAAATAASAHAAGTAAVASEAARTVPIAAPVPPRRTRRPRSFSRTFTSRSPRRLGRSQAAGGLFVGQTLQVAEHHRQTQTLGQPVNLLVHDRGDLGSSRRRSESATAIVDASASRLRRRFALTLASTAARYATRCSRPPAVAATHRTGLAGQHEEGGLEGILDVVLVAEDRRGRSPRPSARDAPPGRRRPGRRGRRHIATGADHPSGQRSSRC